VRSPRSGEDAPWQAQPPSLGSLLGGCITNSYGGWLVPVALVALTCPAGPAESKITLDQAVEIARQEVSFEPESVGTERSTSDSRAVWRVTFRGRLPGQPPGLFETLIVEVDSDTGEVVSVGRT
jgi:hypothetical protein